MVWFAWYPVFTEQKKVAWLRKVIRVWNPHADLRCITVYDPGEYVGSWEYHGQFNWLVAQLVECRTVNAMVAGSIPAQPAIFKAL